MLSDALEQRINRKLHGAYYTPPEITKHLCDRTIHRAVLDAVNARSSRRFGGVAQLLDGLDDATATLLVEEVLPQLSVLDPACGAGAFLIAAANTLVTVYRDVFAWVDRSGGDLLRDRLAALRSTYRSLDDYLTRRVLADNLYGVDLMPEAVEIARRRLALLVEVDGDRSPPMMHVVVGNALLGLLEVLPGMRATQEACDAELLDRFRILGIRYERSTWDLTTNQPGPPERRPMELDDIAGRRPLHWPLAFADVMRRGGFDAIVTNPPWDVFKPNGKEFFEAHSELVTKKSMSIHDFEAEQARLLEDPTLQAAWLDYRSAFVHQSAFFRAAPEYRHQSATAGGRRVGSDLNLYKLFIERCYRLLREGGHCGLVVPSGIYTDLGAKGLREMLFDRAMIESLFCIENRDGVFDDVHRMFKFVVLQFARGGQTRQFPAAFMRRDVSELTEFPARGSVSIDIELIRKLSPDSLSVMEFKSELDVKIARRMARFPLLGEDVPGRWRLRLNREFDMTNDGRLFQTSPAPGRLPLFEGKMIWQFDDRFAEARYWVQERGGRAAILGGDVNGGQTLDYQRRRLGVRAVASNVNARTLIAAIVPANHFCGNSLLVESGGLNEAESLYLAGVMNSFALDWLLRQKITTNVNMFQIYQLPVPRLAAGEAEFDAIVGRVDRLMNVDATERATLRAEIDAIVARLYGLNESEFAHVLATFPLVDARTRERARNALEGVTR
jgi:hypothetical protein